MNYSDLIGVPFQYGGRDHNGLDCFGLVMEMLKRQGVNVHDFGWHNDSAIIQTMMLGASETMRWEPCELHPGAILLFKIGRYVRHVAYVIENNKFIHCWERSNGVVIERINEDWLDRVAGIYKYVE